MINKVILVGRLGKDPGDPIYAGRHDGRQVHASPPTRGTPTRAARNRSAPSGTTSSPWASSAEICGQYLRKGKLVYIEGSIRTDSWDDKESGRRSTAPRSSPAR